LARDWADEALAGAELYRTVAEAATDAIVTIDENSTILLANRAAERTFGYPREALIGQPLTVLMPEELGRRHRDGIQRYLRTARPPRGHRRDARMAGGRHLDSRPAAAGAPLCRGVARALGGRARVRGAVAAHHDGAGGGASRTRLGHRRARLDLRRRR